MSGRGGRWWADRYVRPGLINPVQKVSEYLAVSNEAAEHGRELRTHTGHTSRIDGI